MAGRPRKAWSKLDRTWILRDTRRRLMDLDLFDRRFQLAADLFCDACQRCVLNRLHRRNRVDRRNLCPAIHLLNDYVTRKHGPDLVLGFQCLMGHHRIAGTEYDLGTEVGADLLLQRRMHVDPCQDAEATGLEGGYRSVDSFRKWSVDLLREIVGHTELLYWVGARAKRARTRSPHLMKP